MFQSSITSVGHVSSFKRHLVHVASINTKYRTGHRLNESHSSSRSLESEGAVSYVVGATGDWLGPSVAPGHLRRSQKSAPLPLSPSNWTSWSRCCGTMASRQPDSSTPRLAPEEGRMKRQGRNGRVIIDGCHLRCSLQDGGGVLWAEGRIVYGPIGNEPGKIPATVESSVSASDVPLQKLSRWLSTSETPTAGRPASFSNWGFDAVGTPASTVAQAQFPSLPLRSAATQSVAVPSTAQTQ